jgi:hypothetical protein
LLALVPLVVLTLRGGVGLWLGAGLLLAISLRSFSGRSGLPTILQLAHAERIQLPAVARELLDQQALSVDHASLFHHQQCQEREGEK